MIIDELTHDDIVQVIEHLHAMCSCREECNGCRYADDTVDCVLYRVPSEWRPEEIRKGGDADDPN